MKAIKRIDNYYTATSNDSTQHPVMSGEKRVDVVIVGGGSTGVSTAVELAERGVNVALLEANRIGWGASGRNGGQITGSLSGDAAILKQLQKSIGSDAIDVVRMLRWHGHDIIKNRIEKYGIDCDLQHGHLHTAYTEKDIPELHTAMEDAVAAGLGDDVEWLDRSQVQQKLATPLYHGGILNRRNMHVHSLNLLLGEAAAAKSMGVDIYEQSNVLDITYGDTPTVTTAQGRITANAVVLAGNAYHRLAQPKLRGLLFPAILGNLTTAPLDDQLAQSINPENLAVYDSRMVLDYYRLTADKRLMFGGGTNYSGRDIDNVASTLRPALEKTFPQLKGINIDFSWTGAAGITINRIPALGRIEGNVYYAQGYSGHGIASSHIMAEIMANALTGTMHHFDLFSSLKHIRLPVGPQTGSVLVALGMAYYRLKQSLGH
ncbi:MAG: gamma-glutamylputrescine oxidase [bacterium]|jgi:gamma-glutamylputrescine oxidase